MDILLDMDGVLADFDRGVIESWEQAYPAEPLRPQTERREFYIDNDQPDHVRPRLAAVYRTPGFFRNLKPLPGAQSAVNEMLARGWHINVCTAPLPGQPTCLQEKHDWLLEHFGKRTADQMIIVRDKTVIRGDILIDDRPYVTGLLTPVWEHVIYDHSYNRQAAGVRRLTWANWRPVLGV